MLARLLDAVAACRADAAASQHDAVLSRIEEMRRVHDQTRTMAAQMTPAERGIGFGRFVAYMNEVNTQLLLLQLERPEAYASLTMRIRKEQPMFLEMLPGENLFATATKHNAQISQSQALRAQIELYKLQHQDEALDLRMGWAQLLKRTDAHGRISDNGRFGPYLKAAPVNHLTGGSRIRIITTDAGRIPFGGHGGYDYAYHAPTGCFYSLDVNGNLVEADDDVVFAPARAPQLTSAKMTLKNRPKPRPRPATGPIR